MKCMKNNFLVFTLLCCSFSLLAQNKTPTVSINPKGMATAKTRLSDLIQSIEYIPLETTGNSLIGTVRLFDVSPNYTVIWTLPSRDIYLFKRNGEFVSKIGRLGHGPGEYYIVNGIHINEVKKQIEIISGVYGKSTLFVYDFNGTFQKSVPLDPTLGYCIRKYRNHGLFKNASRGTIRKPVNTYKIATWGNFNIVTEAVSLIPLTFTGSYSGNGTGSPREYLLNGKLYIRDTSLNDTIYQINNDFSFTPYYSLNAGKYEITIELRSNTDKFAKECSLYLSYMDLFEINNHFYFSFLFEKKKYFSAVNKSTGKSYYFPSEKGIPNDWDGGPDIWFTRQDEKTMYGFIPASEFLEHKNKLTPKGPQSAIKRMNELKETLLEDDNPVFVVVTMK